MRKRGTEMNQGTVGVNERGLQNQEAGECDEGHHGIAPKIARADVAACTGVEQRRCRNLGAEGHMCIR